MPPITNERGCRELSQIGKEQPFRLAWDSGGVTLWHGLECYRFDLCGRPWSVTRKNDIFRRGFDGRILRIWREYEEDEKFHACERLDEKATVEFLRSVVHKVDGLRPLLGKEFGRLEPALHIDLEDDARRFRHLYGEVGILPPDCYRALLLNLTQGCSYNRCSFCHFFKDQSFSLRTVDQFRAHIDQAKLAFGPSMASRRSIFLGKANAANAPFEALEGALETIMQTFPSEFMDRARARRHRWGFERVCAFMDTFSQLRRTPRQWQTLQKMGLQALYLGVESGSPEILKLLRKPGHPRLIKELVDTLKGIGMEVNIILMTGVGGKEMATEHLDSTVSFLNSLRLTAGDRVYLSAFTPSPGSLYSRLAEERELTPLSRLECRRQSVALRQRLRFAPFLQGPAVTLYDIHQFVY